VTGLTAGQGTTSMHYVMTLGKLLRQLCFHRQAIQPGTDIKDRKLTSGYGQHMGASSRPESGDKHHAHLLQSCEKVVLT